MQQRGNMDTVGITYFTDPLCCWSWAFEPQWRRLQQDFGDKINWKYCMGGLIPNWNTFNDPMNAISRPQQMGPLWMYAQQVSGMPISDMVWLVNPPASSYPSCIAVKCAGLQGQIAEEMYLRMLREAIMIDGLDISKEEIFMEIAANLSNITPEIFNYNKFKKAIDDKSGIKLFQEDLHKVAYHQISRFPTLVFSRNGYPSIMIVGYRPYEALQEAVKQIAPDFTVDHPVYLGHLFKGRITERESVELNFK